MEQTRLTPWEPVAVATVERIEMDTLKNPFGVNLGLDTGFSSYATWAVNLSLWTAEGSYAYWRDAAREARREARSHPRVREQLWTEKEAARFRLAERMMKEVCEAAPLGEVRHDTRYSRAELYSDLLRMTLAEVEWLEVADKFLAIPEFPE
jgi:hypothetical protein